MSPILKWLLIGAAIGGAVLLVWALARAGRRTSPGAVQEAGRPPVPNLEVTLPPPAVNVNLQAHRVALESVV